MYVVCGSMIYSGGCAARQSERTERSVVIFDPFRCSSVLRLPGLRDVETMPWFPYLRCSSFENTTVACDAIM